VSNPYQVVKDFEQALCEYTGSKYAVTTTSCTMALLLACKWHWKGVSYSSDPSDYYITIPSRTYCSVPQSIIHAGLNPKFEDVAWEGMYQLKPSPVWDSARLFTYGMYSDFYVDYGDFICLSFHWSKTLAIGQGGAILHDSDAADYWFRRARFDGRAEGVAPKDDMLGMLGYHCYMSPRDAADGLSRLAVLPKHNAPLPNDDYPDLSKFYE